MHAFFFKLAKISTACINGVQGGESMDRIGKVTAFMRWFSWLYCPTAEQNAHSYIPLTKTAKEMIDISYDAFLCSL